MGEVPDFDAFVAAHQAQLVRFGWALTGDRHLGDDLVQASLERLWRRWPTVAAAGDPSAYLHRIMINLWSSWRSRRFRAVEVSVAKPSEPAARSSDWTDQIGERLDVDRWLNAVPPRQRAALVLRFLLDLSVEQTAQRLGCSAGTVKSQTAKALQAMRVALCEDSVEEL